MQTYILRGKWDSERRAKDLDSLRKWLANIYKGDMGSYTLDVYLKTKSGKRFIGKIASYDGSCVWYSHLPSTVNGGRKIDLKTGKLI